MIAEAIQQITSQLPTGTRLVAVSKYHPAEAIREAFAAGQRLFGESHAQELRAKHEELQAMERPEAVEKLEEVETSEEQEGLVGTGNPARLSPLEWHFIGHLQTNKVKYIAPYVSLIHSADSPRLLEEVNRQALKAGRTIRCLLQLHVAQEQTKFGFTPDEALAYLDSGAWQQLTGVQLAGVMAMASNTDDTARIRDDFRRTRQFFERMQSDYFPLSAALTRMECSMGMSDDWHIAVDEGSTLIRVGTAIFGQRQY